MNIPEKDKEILITFYNRANQLERKAAFTNKQQFSIAMNWIEGNKGDQTGSAFLASFITAGSADLLKASMKWELNTRFSKLGWGIKGLAVAGNWTSTQLNNLGMLVPGPKWLKKEAGKVATMVVFGFARGAINKDSPRLNSRWIPYKFFRKFWENSWTDQTHGGRVVSGSVDVAHLGIGGLLGLWSQGQGYSREDAMSLSVLEHFIIFESVVEAYDPWEYGDMMSDLYGVMSVY